jgi:spore maturation protein CgeB
MKFVMFYHSVVSCWNHGNAHFLRGIARELMTLGHEVVVYEPEGGWSRLNASAEGGEADLAPAAKLVPGIKSEIYRTETLDVEQATDNADVVMVHEWNMPALVTALGRQRQSGARYTLLFHDTHHRAVTAPEDMSRYDLDGYDGVLAFGEVLRDIYQRRGWGRHVFTWHEAADTALFHPLPSAKDLDLIWIGNWGDGERTRELDEFLIKPAWRLRLRTRIHGVRYPDETLAALSACKIEHAGWLPNHRVPQAFAQAKLTVHVPRGPYTQALPGIPTIRVFEALACGIPLISAPWSDCEGLFPDGAYLPVRNSEEMQEAMRLLLHDDDIASSFARMGLDAIHQRHTCAHRVDELLAIIAIIKGRRQVERDPALPHGVLAS